MKIEELDDLQRLVFAARKLVRVIDTGGDYAAHMSNAAKELEIALWPFAADTRFKERDAP